MKSFFKLGSILSRGLPLWLLAWFLGVFSAVSAVGLLAVSGWFITAAGVLGALAVSTHASLWIQIFAIGRIIGRYGDLMASHQAVFGQLRRLRLHFFEAFARLPTQRRTMIGSSNVQHRLVKDIDALSDFALRFVGPWVVVSCVLVFASIVLCVFVGIKVYWVLGVLLLCAGGSLWAFKLTQAHSTLQELRQSTLVYALPALTQLLLWDKWRQLMSQIGEQDQALTAIHERQNAQKILTVFLVQMLFLALLLLVFWVGVPKVVAGQLSAAYLLAAVLGVFGLMEVVSALTNDLSAFAKSKHAKDSLNALLAAESTSPGLPVPDRFDVVVQKLCARQKGAVLGLCDITTTIKQGVPLVVMGASGVGKSTFLQALAGELEFEGKVLVDALSQQRPMRDFDWQTDFGFLGQQVDIFDQSLADNLRLGKPCASDDELWEALRLVSLESWARQAQGLDTPLGEYGAKVSGGQARRIALARLLLSPKRVLLLDEPFAGLDEDNRERLWRVLQKRQACAILVVVSHHRLQGQYETLVIGQTVPVK